MDAVVVVRCVVARERVVARIVQVDAVVIARCVIIRDVAVLPPVEINPCLPGTCRPCHIESGDVHIVRSHIKDVIRSRSPYIHHIRALAYKREMRCPDVHVLIVNASRNMDRLASSRSIDRRLYRHAACIERAAVTPPAGCVDANVCKVYIQHLPLKTVVVTSLNIGAVIVDIHIHPEQSVGSVFVSAPAIQHDPVSVIWVCIVVAHTEHRMTATPSTPCMTTGVVRTPEIGLGIVIPEGIEGIPIRFSRQAKCKPDGVIAGKNALNVLDGNIITYSLREDRALLDVSDGVVWHRCDTIGRDCSTGSTSSVLPAGIRIVPRDCKCSIYRVEVREHVKIAAVASITSASAIVVERV